MFVIGAVSLALLHPDNVALLEASNSIVCAALVLIMTGLLLAFVRYLDDRAPTWILLIPTAWLTVVIANRALSQHVDVPVTVVASALRPYSVRKGHVDHDLVLSGASGHQWSARFLAARGESAIAPNTPGTAALSIGPLWTRVDSLTLASGRYVTSAMP